MLSGEHDCGKTTTLNLVYDSIKQSADIIEEKTTIGKPEDKDFECIIRYNGKIVAFYTLGDISHAVCNAFKKYDDLSCDILVCASFIGHKRPRQRIKKYPHTIIEKRRMPDFKAANEVDKNRILQLL
jgi:hypothetical protein